MIHSQSGTEAPVLSLPGHDRQSADRPVDPKSTFDAIGNVPMTPVPWAGHSWSDLQKLSRDRLFCFARKSSHVSVERPVAAFPPPKPFVGFNRLSQALRQVSSGIYRTMKKSYGLNPVEVQASILSGRLHLSSNFHSDRLADAFQLLSRAAFEPAPIKDAPACKPRKREERHIEKLFKHFGSAASITTRVDKGVREILQGAGLPAYVNLEREEIAVQFRQGMAAVADALRHAMHGAPAAISVEHSYADDRVDRFLAIDVSKCRHAERNIVDGLSSRQQELYEEARGKLGLAEGKHVVVCLEGRFVPCASCYEQEAEERIPRSGGIFDPAAGRFVLHRSTDRAGRFFFGEVHYLTKTGLGPSCEIADARAHAISDRIWIGDRSLHTHGKPVVLSSSYGTDSDESDMG